MIGVQLTHNHRRLRLQWTRTHQRWNMAQWRTVLFSYESRFSLDFADRCRRVWRRRNERYVRCCTAEHDRYGGGSVMVWGAVSWNHKSDLVVIDGNLKAQRYVNEILRPNVLPLVRRYNLIFQQDNARPHTARISTDFINNQNIWNLPWPARSPDLSPIEHVCDILGRNVRSRHHVSKWSLLYIRNGMQYLRIRLGILSVRCTGNVWHAYAPTAVTPLIEHCDIENLPLCCSETHQKVLN